jgi:hypothetical protein
MGFNLLETDCRTVISATINSVRSPLLYTNGFRRAAEIITDEVLQTCHGHDYLVYPLMFNYRHFVELAIKDVLSMLAELAFGENNANKHHRLDELWSFARQQLFDKWSFESDDQQLKPIDDMIKFLHGIDSTSTGFRYSDASQNFSC